MADFLTFQQVLEELSKYVTTGMSVEQFISIAMKKGYGPVGSGGLWFNYAAQESAIGSAITSVGTAGELWATSGAGTVASNAVVSAGGSTTTLTAVKSLPTVAEVVTTSEGVSTVTTGAGSLLSVPKSTFIAAAAPALGVAIGVGAYKSDPKFWTGLSMKLLPFLYDSDDTVASVMLANGEMYYSKESLEAIGEYFKSQDIYGGSYKLPDGNPSENTMVTSVTPPDTLRNMMFSHMSSRVAAGQKGAKTALQYLTAAFEDEKFLDCFYKYPDNVRQVSVIGSPSGYSPTVSVSVLDITTGEVFIDKAPPGVSWKVPRVKCWNTYPKSQQGYGYDVSCYTMYNRGYHNYGDVKVVLLGCNGAPVSHAPENTTIIGTPDLPDFPNSKEFVTGVDDDGNLITKPFIPLKLPASNDGSSTSTKEDAHGPSTDDATLKFLIDLINNQKKPKPNPAYDPTTNPSTKPNTSTNTSPNIPNKIPVANPTKPSDNGHTPPIALPVGNSADGLISVYNPTKKQLQEFGKWLWTTWSSDILDTLSKMFNTPMDGVIGLHELYATPSTSEMSTIKCGYLNSDVPSLLVDKRYTEINCGSMIISEYWNNYLDYAPYTTINCYLPFIGMVELDPKDVINCAINITYVIDSYNGSCIAQVRTVKDNFDAVTYQFSGNCAVEVPISSGNYSNVLSTAIGLGASGLATYATGGAAAPMLAGATASMMRTGSNVSHSGSFGASHGAMGFKKPFIEVKSKIQKKVHDYNEDYGYPAHKRVTIKECSGFLKVKEVNVISSTATIEEKKMIKELLKSGVYVD